MEILSKDTLKILSNESVRKGVEDVMTPGGREETTVSVPKCDSKDKGSDSASITIRRLSI